MSIKKISHIFYCCTMCIFFSISIGNCQDQKYVDSILKVIPTQESKNQFNSYRRLFVEHISVNPEAAKPYNDSSMVVAKRNNNNFFIACAFNDQAVYLNKTGQFNKSLDVFDDAIKLFRDVGDKEQESATLNNKSNVLVTVGRLNEAIETHITSLKLKEELKITYIEDGEDYWDESIAASYWNIGSVYGDIENYETSNEYYSKAEKIYERLNLIDDLMLLRRNIAINYKLTQQYSKAISIFKNTIPYDLSENYFHDAAISYDNLGHTYFFTDSLEKAKSNFNKAIAMFEEHKDPSLKGISLRHIGQVFMKENKYSQALSYFNQSLEISTNTNAVKDKISDFHELAKAYAAIGTYDKAYEFYDKYNSLHKEVLGQENIEKINDLEIRYDTERKEKALIIKDSEIALFEAKEEKNELQRNAIIISAISALSILLILIYGLRQKMKRNKLLKEKLDAELEFKKKELTNHAMQLAKKNEVLESLKSKAKALKAESFGKNGYQQLIHTINFDLQDDKHWENFSQYFEQAYQGFNKKIKTLYPEINSNDLRLIGLLKMNLTNKEVASILNISSEGVKKARYRLRKKLVLSTEESLEETILNL